MDPNSQNPYDFIMNPAKPVRRNPFTNGNFLTKIVIVIGIGVLLMIILGIIATSATRGSDTPELLSIAQQQKEINRVGSAGLAIARTQKARNFGATTGATIYSNNLSLIKYLASARSTKVNEKILGLKRNPVTDQKLSAARDASEFDEVYLKIMQTNIQQYQLSIKQTFQKAKGAKEKQLLSSYYAQSQLLLQQSTEQF